MKWKHREGRRRQHRHHKARTKLRNAALRLYWHTRARMQAAKPTPPRRYVERRVLFIGGPFDGERGSLSMAPGETVWKCTPKFDAAEFYRAKGPVPTHCELITYVMQTWIDFHGHTLCHVMRHDSLSEKAGAALVASLLNCPDVRELIRCVRTHRPFPEWQRR